MGNGRAQPCGGRSAQGAGASWEASAMALPNRIEPYATLPSAPPPSAVVGRGQSVADGGRSPSSVAILPGFTLKCPARSGRLQARRKSKCLSINAYQWNICSLKNNVLVAEVFHTLVVPLVSEKATELNQLILLVMRGPEVARPEAKRVVYNR